MEMTSAFTLNVRLDNIAVITIDVPGEKMNTLKAEFASQVRGSFSSLTSSSVITGPGEYHPYALLPDNSSPERR